MTSTATLVPVRVLDAAARTTLSTLLERHFEAAEIAAECDDSAYVRRPDLDQIMALLCTEAYISAAMLTDSSPVAVATNVPPALRRRELASAQRMLVAAVNDVTESGPPASDVVEMMSRSADRVRLLAARLADAVTPLHR